MQVVLRAQDSARLRVIAESDAGGIPFPGDEEIVIGPFIVPEPATIALLALATFGLLLTRHFALRR